MPSSPEFPCSACYKGVNKNHRALQCDICDNWIHLRCNFLDLSEYNRLKKDTDYWFCTICLKEILPFQNLSKNELIPLVTRGISFSPEQVSQDINPQTQNHLNNISNYINRINSNLKFIRN